MSLSRPGSHCPGCGAPIPWYRNLPVLTWLLQRGRCARCGCRIPTRYVLVEAFCALLGFGWAAMALAGIWGEAGEAAGWIVFALAGVPIALIDWDTFEIPDGLVVAAGVGAGVVRAVLAADPTAMLLPVLEGALLSAGLFYAISFGSRVFLGWIGAGARCSLRATRPRRHGWSRMFLRLALRWSRFDGNAEALGLGDVSLGLAAGAALGFLPVLLGLPIAALLGLVGHLVAAGARTRARDVGLDSMSIPFGPFLVAGFLLAAILLAPGIPVEFSFLPFP